MLPTELIHRIGHINIGYRDTEPTYYKDGCQDIYIFTLKP